MPRETPVRSVMTTDVLSFTADENVTDAVNALVERGVDGGPVVDADRRVVGMLTSSDLIVAESRLHVPTAVTILGATLTLPSEKKHFDEEVRRALGATVGEVMAADPVTVGPDDTVEDAATALHQHDVSRVAVVDADGRLVGIVARNDILRVIMRDDAGS